MLLFRVEAVPTKQPYLSSLFRELSSFHLSSHSLQGNNDLLIMKRWTVYRWWFVLRKKNIWDHDFFRIWLLKWNTDRKMASIQKMRDRLGRLGEKKNLKRQKIFKKIEALFGIQKMYFCFVYLFGWMFLFGVGVFLVFLVGWFVCHLLAFEFWENVQNQKI